MGVLRTPLCRKGATVPRTQTYTYTLPSGTVIYIENDESGEHGAREVSKDRNEVLPFPDVIRPIGEVAELVFDAVKSQVVHPDKITLEFGATFKGGSTCISSPVILRRPLRCP
jgi:hypothetical protein